MKKVGVTLHFKMRFVWPRRMNPGARKTLVRMIQSADYLNSMARKSITADLSTLRDVTDVMEHLANTTRRARASAYRKGGQ